MTVSVYDHNDQNNILKEIRLPKVFACPLRQDIVQHVHDNLAKNSRQAHGVDRDAGMRHSAESWGTGRAVARIPRVSGSGSGRNGQAAFGNMVRKGRMAFPVVTHRRWHRKINLRMRRHALASAVAATAIHPLIAARGHKIDKIPQLPLVLDSEVNKIQKTKEIIKVLKRFGCFEDVERVIEGRVFKTGVQKTRAKKYRTKKGPLVVVNDEGESLTRALRNIPGVDIINVQRLNIKYLAPGGQLGRLTIYTQGAINELGRLFGSKLGCAEKKDYRLQREVISNPDIASIINSDNVQSVLRDKKEKVALHFRQKWNPLKNKELMQRLNPFSAEQADKKKKIVKDASKGKQYREKSQQFLRSIADKVADKQNSDITYTKDILKKTKVY